MVFFCVHLCVEELLLHLCLDSQTAETDSCWASKGIVVTMCVFSHEKRIVPKWYASLASHRPFVVAHQVVSNMSCILCLVLICHILLYCIKWHWTLPCHTYLIIADHTLLYILRRGQYTCIMLDHTLSYHVISHHITFHHTLSFHIVSHHTSSYLSLLHSTLSLQLSLSCLIMHHPIFLYFIIPHQSCHTNHFWWYLITSHHSLSKFIPQHSLSYLVIHFQTFSCLTMPFHTSGKLVIPLTRFILSLYVTIPHHISSHLICTVWCWYVDAGRICQAGSVQWTQRAASALWCDNMPYFIDSYIFWWAFWQMCTVDFVTWTSNNEDQWLRNGDWAPTWVVWPAAIDGI